MGNEKTFSGRVFDVCNYAFLTFFSICTILPLIYMISGSFASNTQLATSSFFLIPEHATMAAYQYIFSTGAIIRGLIVSVYVTVLGTLLNLAFTATMAYALSRKELPGRNFVLNLIIFSMVFSGGLIPTYFVVKQLGMLDTLWSLMIPGLIDAFNLIIMKNFFQGISTSLIEAAKIDGCSDIGVFLRIVLPLSKPALATFALFYAVGHWNDFMSALLYINNSNLWPLQMLLQEIVTGAQSLASQSLQNPGYVPPPAQSIQMAVMVISTLPLVLLYPFLQKYFVKGVMIGAIKE
ncbi:carbohydrate ABC transporter permease [Alicyclobacillus fodiniaquatilis]|jgi:putative aldouronate transport system permease protein|uniref:Carbohydrate ABC transporter permease n=1 Tax=Alicyclobacillus fodiniaquatilis TaxID=1661150 RepID=A0ABW4JG73_9BACL